MNKDSDTYFTRRILDTLMKSNTIPGRHHSGYSWWQLSKNTTAHIRSLTHD